MIVRKYQKEEGREPWKGGDKVLIEKKKREGGPKLKLRKRFGTNSRPRKRELSAAKSSKLFSLLGFAAQGAGIGADWIAAAKLHHGGNAWGSK